MRAARFTALANRVREGRCKAFCVRVNKGFMGREGTPPASASRK